MLVTFITAELNRGAFAAEPWRREVLEMRLPKTTIVSASPPNLALLVGVG